VHVCQEEITVSESVRGACLSRREDRVSESVRCACLSRREDRVSESVRGACLSRRDDRLSESVQRPNRRVDETSILQPCCNLTNHWQ